MNKIYFILLVNLLVSLPKTVQGQNHDFVYEEQNFMPNELSMLVDTLGNTSLEELINTEAQYKFEVFPAYQNVDFIPGAVYWIRLPIHIDANQSKQWLLEFYDQTIDSLVIWLPKKEGGYSSIVLGDHQPFDQRLIRHKNFEVPLETWQSGLTFYFQIKSHEFADLRIALRSVNRFVNYALSEYFLFGTFYGMILIISLYNLMVFFAIREIKNLYYVFYILCVAAYAASLDGIGFQYLWKEHPLINDYAVGLSLYLVIIMALIFTRRFLSLKVRLPLLDKILVGIILVRSLIFISFLIWLPQYLPYRNIDILPLSFIFYCAIKSWILGYRPARFFVIAYGFLFLGFFIRLLVYFNLVAFTILSHYSIHIAFVLEMLFLTFALGDRIRILKDMRDRALRRIISQHEVNMKLKDQVTRELEVKVKERTIQLNKKNKELEEINFTLNQQATEINQINTLLDLDNWKLKNSVKTVLEERLQGKLLDRTQFMTLYPNGASCYRFLENLKWRQGFVCRKCSGTRSISGVGKFDKRCSRCGFNDSITSGTLFHGLKFPIEKAFYLAYLFIGGQSERTLEQLAEENNLGVQAVWAFKQKVNKHVTKYDMLGHPLKFRSWEDVLLDPLKKVQELSQKSRLTSGNI